jgi:hypothetical protein
MRATRKMIEALCTRVNKANGLSDNLYVRSAQGGLAREPSTGHLVTNAGVVYLTGQTGGWRIEKMCEGGGSSDLLHASYESKKIVYLTLLAYLIGKQS